MKSTIISIFFFSILVSSIIICSNENLPFLNGKYLIWLGILCIIAFVFAFKNNCKTFKINCFDLVLLFLGVFGTIQFMLFSKSTIYNCEIWYYIGYLALYLLFRNQCTTFETTTKILTILLYFCSGSAVLNILLMVLQWKHLIDSPNQFFLTTGMFFSPNQLGIYLSIGFLSTFFLWQKNNVFWIKIVLGLSAILIFLGLCITESRGAFISLFVALGYYFSPSLSSLKRMEPETKFTFNWKYYIRIGVLLVGSFYFLAVVNKSKTESTSGQWFATKLILKQIAEQPFGYGLNSFSVEYNKAKATYFENNSNWEEMKNAGYIYKANNDLLELTFELGIPWILLFLFFIVLLFRTKNSGVETQIGRTLLVSLVIFSLTSSITMTPILVVIGSVCSVLIINLTPSKVIFELKNNVLYRLMGIGVSLSFVFISIARINAENQLFKLYNKTIYLKGENQLENYISKIDYKGEEFFMGGLTLLKNGSVNEGIRYLQIGFERSGKPSLGRILAKGLQKHQKYDQAEEIYTYNKNVDPYRFEARMDLFNLFKETKQNKKARAMALEIIQLPVKVASTIIEGYKRKAKQYLQGFEPK